MRLAELHEVAAVAAAKLEGVMREFVVANEAVNQARAEVRKLSETAAELRGRISSAKPVKGKTDPVAVKD